MLLHLASCMELRGRLPSEFAQNVSTGTVTMTDYEIKRAIKARPRAIKSGEAAFFTQGSLIEKKDEVALTLALITHRRLFGEVYAGIDPKYFINMPPKSGVFVRPFVRTDRLIPNVKRPGDIDLLIIPYEGDNILLHKVVAVEIKIIRTSFCKQSKSPNEFGFSQASQLYEIGFPYVAVAHLIVSDKSPREAWRNISVFEIIYEHGRVEPLPDRDHDMMPADLIDRAFGRLRKICPNKNFGIVSAYLGSNDTLISQTYHEEGIWLPFCRKAQANDNISIEIMDRIVMYFEKNSQTFLDNPRFDPD